MCERLRSLRLLMLGRSIRATRYRDATLVRSHFMSGRMRKPNGSAAGGERKSTLSASDRPAMISFILWKTPVSVSHEGEKTQATRTRGCMSVGTNHWVRDAGNASMYGLTMRSYNAGVSRTMWNCCLEYCTRRKQKGHHEKSSQLWHTGRRYHHRGK
jgi:hypothetical protein